MPPPPRAFAVLVQQSGAAKLARDRRKRAGRRRQIKQPVAAGASRRFQSLDLLLHRVERGRIARIGFHRRDAFKQPLGDGGISSAQKARAGVQRTSVGHSSIAFFNVVDICFPEGSGQLVRGRNARSGYKKL